VGGGKIEGGRKEGDIKGKNTTEGKKWGIRGREWGKRGEGVGRNKEERKRAGRNTREGKDEGNERKEKGRKGEWERGGGSKGRVG